MARDIENDLTNVNPADGTNPYGNIRDKSSPTATDGTPVNEAMLGDICVFFQKLLDEGNIQANNQPENAVNGFQFFDALLNLQSVTSGQPAENFIARDPFTIQSGSPNTGAITDLAVNNDGTVVVFVGASGTDRIMVSVDGGFNFNNAGDPLTQGNYVAVCHSPTLDIFVAGTNNNSGTTSLIYSADGVNWTVGSFPNLGSVFVSFIEESNGTFIAGLSNGTVLRSLDGQAWNQISSGSFINNSIDALQGNGNGVWVLAYNNANNPLLRSADNGQTWAQITNPMIPNRFGNIAYSAGVYVGILNTNGVGDIAYSLDEGLTWTRVSSGMEFGVDVVGGKGRFIGLANGSANENVASSIDGINWNAGFYKNLTLPAEFPSFCKLAANRFWGIDVDPSDPKLIITE